jgi:YbbR domain-containing protein
VRALPGVLTRNWTLKLSAFGIALLLWVSVRVEAPSRQTVSGVPIRVNLADPQWALVDDPSPSSVVVRFGGPSRELLRMAVDRPSLVIPMDQVGSSDTTVVLRNEWIRLQDRPNVVVEEIQPSSVALTLEPIQRVELPLAVRLNGELPSGLALTRRPEVIPVEVRVSGPQSRLEEMDSVPLRPFDLSTLESSGRVPVSVRSDVMEGLHIQPARAELDFQVEAAGQRVVGEVPLAMTVEGWEERYQLSHSSGSVTLTGALSLLEELDEGAIWLRVRLEDDELPEEAGDEVEAALEVEGLPELVEVEWSPREVTVVRLGGSDADALDEPVPEEDPEV